MIQYFSLVNQKIGTRKSLPTALKLNKKSFHLGLRRTSHLLNLDLYYQNLLFFRFLEIDRMKIHLKKG